MEAGHSRTHRSLRALFTFTRAIWLGRNDVLHKDKETIETKAYTVESAELRHFHANPNLLPSADRHYCTISLKRLLGSRPSVRRRWLRRVRTARANLIKDGKTQQRMTQYTEQTARNPPRRISATDPIKKNNSNVRSVTTQQRMTTFYPGRPPDSTDKNTTINPPPAKN